MAGHGRADLSLAILQQVGTALKGTIDAAVARTTQATAETELTEAESSIIHHDPLTAEVLFERVRRRYWADLSDSQRYRLQVGRANVAISQGRHADAGSLLIEAKLHQPLAEKAQINEALGYELLEKREQAYALADSLLPSYPHSPHLVSCWLRTAPPDARFEELKKQVSAITERDAQVNLALAIRAATSERYEEAESFARKAVAANPEWPGAKSWLGQELILQQIRIFKRLVSIRQVRRLTQPKVLEEAIIVLSQAIDLANRQKSMPIHADCYVFRAMAHGFLGKDDEADSDYITALRLISGNAAVHFRYATYLLHQNRIDEAITQLKKSLAIVPGAEAAITLADTLLRRNRPGDLEESSKLLTKLVTTNDKDLRSSVPSPDKDLLIALRSEGFSYLIQNYVDCHRLDEAEKLIADIPEGRFSDAIVSTARSRIKLAAGDLTAASALADEAIRHLSETTLHVDLRSLAIHLMKLERHKDALPLWQKLSGKDGYDSDFWNLIGCAERVKQFGLVLEACQTAMDSGFYDERYLERECLVLEMFDIERAVTLLQNHIADNPDDKFARTQLSRLGLILRRPSLATASTDMLIGVEEATPITGAVVVDILRHFGDPNEAVRYAYELVRRHYRNHIACRSLVMAVLAYRTRSPVFTDCDVVGPGVAVRYSERKSPEKWAIIEDSANPDVLLHEYDAETHPLAKSILGKRVGDTFIIAETSGQDRIGRIHEIIPKYIYRARDICENWQERFPDIHFIQVFRVATAGSSLEGEQVDLTEIKLVADNRHDQIKEAEEYFRNHLVTFCNFAKALGCSTHEAFVFAAQNPKLLIRSNAGRDREQRTGLEALRAGPVLVLDITAFASLMLLGITEFFEKWPGKVVISQDTAAALHGVIEDAEAAIKSAGVFGRGPSGYFFHTESPEESRAHADRVRSFIQLVLGKCDVHGCPGLAYMDPELREVLADGLGKDVVESMLLARAPDHVLWTEDYLTAEVAAHEFGVCRVWAQLIIEHSYTAGLFSKDLFLESSAKLLGYRFEATLLNHVIIWKAGELAEWDIRRWPLAQALHAFENKGIEVANAAVLAALTIIGLFNRVSSHELRKDVITEIFDRLLWREGGREAITHLYFALPKLFPHDRFARDEVFEIIRGWAAEVSKRSWITRLPQAE